MADDLADMERQRDAALLEVERLTRERDEWQRSWEAESALANRMGRERDSLARRVAVRFEAQSKAEQERDFALAAIERVRKIAGHAEEAARDYAKMPGVAAASELRRFATAVATGLRQALDDVDLPVTALDPVAPAGDVEKAAAP